MNDISIILGLTPDEWFLSFCLAAVLVGLRIGIRLVFDSFHARAQLK
jgi:hypothetical protein